MRAKKEGRRNRKGGFTAVETMVAVVVLAILSAYAIPKLFGLKDQADATEETLKIKDIEARHAQEILKAGKRGDRPRLGDVVGFRPEAVEEPGEPAPETAPMLVNYSYRFNLRLPTTIDANGLILGLDKTTKSLWIDKNGDDIASCSELGDLLDWHPSYSNNIGKQYYDNVGLEVEHFGDGRSFQTTPIGPHGDKNVPITDPIPHCQIDSLTTRRWYTSPGTNRVHLTFPHITSQTHQYVSTVATTTNYAMFGSSTTRIKAFGPNRFFYDCRSYSEQYGVPYVIRGAPVSSINGKEYMTLSDANKSPVFQMAESSQRVVQRQDDPTLYDRITDPFNMTPHENARCERDGPAPEPAPEEPSDPGSPGAYPIATDGSGYCLSPGRKLPTYKDGAGTPTSSPSDIVAEIATEAVDDPTNCPG